ncbi:hypothetical protein SAMN05444008_10533 [Cnuella takakiae]|uniref:Uncharacterized protein n=1 Tax=Cnuella takakiae TaxID=1302690 RepID=A0A1M4YZC5_9BACT|nr:hypothetical protein SAMN05444008_10533 [Cnuella takakiae]
MEMIDSIGLLGSVLVLNATVISNRKRLKRVNIYCGS